MLIIFNMNNGSFHKLCAMRICVHIQYGISLTENGRFYVEIEEDEVCVVQASPEIKNRKYIFFVFKYVSVSDLESN